MAFNKEYHHAKGLPPVWRGRSASSDDAERQPQVAGDGAFSIAQNFKGENYKGLPYVMLDYPRQFARNDVFAIRTMFWWGNFISVTWQLKGIYQDAYRHEIVANHAVLADAGFQLCISEDEWRHDFEADNYRSIAGMSAFQLGEALATHHFCKIAINIPLSHWNNATEKLLRIYQTIFEVGGINFQVGERGLSPGSPKAGFDL